MPHRVVVPQLMARLLCLLICCLLLVAWVGEPSIERDPVLYSGLWRSPFVVLSFMFEPLPGIRLFPWQLLLVSLAPACLTVPGSFRHRSTSMDLAIILAFGAIVVTFAWGVLRGGSAYMAYYQLWRFLTALLLALLLSSVLRSPRDLRALAVTILVAAIIRGSLVVYFYWAHIRGKVVPAPEYLINHDDSLLFVIAVLIVMSWAIAKGTMQACALAALVFLHQMYAMVLNDRRLAYVELAFGLMAIYAMMGRGRWRRRIHRWAAVATPILLIYVVVGLNTANPFFAPVQGLATTGSYADSSSLARLEEMRNLIYTLTFFGNPLLGTGWGQPYQRVSGFYAHYSPDWITAPYTPHNSLVGLAAYSGLAGVFGFLLTIPVAAYLAARAYRQSEHRVNRVSMMVAMGSLPAYSVHCYGDIGLMSFQCNLFFGVALAVASTVATWRPTRRAFPLADQHSK